VFGAVALYLGVNGYQTVQDGLDKEYIVQVRGIEKMVEDERYCIDILTQFAAANTAPESVAFKVLDDHVNHCVTDALASGDAEVASEKSSELLDAVQRFARTR